MMATACAAALATACSGMSRQARYTASGIATGAGVALIAAGASNDDDTFITGDEEELEQTLQLASIGVVLVAAGTVGLIATAAAGEPREEEATPWLRPGERTLSVELQAACATWRRELAGASGDRRTALEAARPVHCANLR